MVPHVEALSTSCLDTLDPQGTQRASSGAHESEPQPAADTGTNSMQGLRVQAKLVAWVFCLDARVT